MISEPEAHGLYAAYRRKYWRSTLAFFVRHNPQALLTDQRSDLMKLIGDHRKLGEVYHEGGIIPPFQPYQEMIAAVDFGPVEARVLSHMTGRQRFKPRIQIYAYGLGRLGKAFNRVAEEMRYASKRMALYSAEMSERFDREAFKRMFGDEVDLRPDRTFEREHRIAYLLRSKDRRQRKRGLRLFRVWDANRTTGINWTSPTGRSIDPAYYRKD